MSIKYWTTGNGNTYHIKEMSTPHLYCALKMVWNHYVPDDLQIKPFRRYATMHHSKSWLMRAIKPFADELLNRTDLNEKQFTHLTHMIVNLHKLEEPMIEFKAVARHDIDELNHEVTKLMRYGFTPSGNLIIVKGKTSGDKSLFAQVLTRESDDCGEPEICNPMDTEFAKIMNALYINRNHFYSDLAKFAKKYRGVMRADMVTKLKKYMKQHAAIHYGHNLSHGPYCPQCGKHKDDSQRLADWESLICKSA